MCGRAAHEIESEVDGGPGCDDYHGERQAKAAVVVVFRAHMEARGEERKRVFFLLPNGFFLLAIYIQPGLVLDQIFVVNVWI